MKVIVITMSDRASRGEYADRSGPRAEELLKGRFPEADVSRLVVSDEPRAIRSALRSAYASKPDFIVTSGGTGIGPRDNTPEVTRRFCDRELSGVAEVIRSAGLKETPMAALSRGYCGMRGSTIVINLPGSVNGVETGIVAVAPLLEHAIRMMKGHGHE